MQGMLASRVFTNGFSLDFDGIDDYVLVLSDSVFEFAKADAFSVSFWVKESGSDARFCVAKHNDVTTTFNWDIGIDSSNYPVFRCDSHSGGTSLTGSGTTSAGWNNVIATYSNGAMEIYLNGSSGGTGTYTGAATANTSYLTFAKAQYSSNTAAVILDEIAIWNAQLDADAAAVVGASPFDLMYKNGNYDYQSNLVGYWRLEEGTGATAADSTTNGNNGSTINASPWSSDTP